MEEAKTTALKALRLAFRPLARILLKAGVNWKELVEVCKATYVEVAGEDFGIRGRPTNVSRVAILTGFSRREVRRLRDLLEQESLPAFGRMNYATRVLTGWFTDEDFLGSDGRPRALAAHGKNPSFETLCSRYSGDVPATTMLKELRNVGAVTEDDKGRLVAQSRSYIPAPTDPQQMLRIGNVLEEIGSTMAHNLHNDEQTPRRFERRATNTQIPANAIPAFRDFIEIEGQAFLERIDAWLTEHEDAEADNGVRLGLGAYWIEDHNTERSQP
ncbi:MAG: DUF6502 family protein [Woeseiaceae bacterium]|nr:DUF6502 family protein [Woeseiaceae bacterium]